MLTQHHIACRLRTTLLAALITLLALVSPVSGQTSDAESAVQAISTVTRWVHDFETPPIDSDRAAVALSDVTATCVQLRKRGRVIGFGMDDGGDDRMLRRAAGRALAATLNDRNVRELPEELRSTIGADLTIEVELAGNLQPVAGRRFARAAEAFDPGRHGIAVRRRDTLVWRFPCEMLAEGTAERVEQQIRQLAIELKLPPRAELDALITEHDVSVYRFETSHLVLPTGAAVPLVLQRGDTVVPMQRASLDTARELADDIAMHLINRFVDIDDPDKELEVIGFRADVRANAALPPLQLEGERNTLMGMIALARYAGSSYVDQERATAARNVVRAYLDESSFTSESDDANIVALRVLMLYAWARLNEPVDRASWTASHDALRRVSNMQTTNFAPITQALIAYAASQTLMASPSALDADRVRGLIESAMASVEEPQLPTLLPWLGWAALDYAHYTNSEIPGADVLANTIDRLASSLVGATDRPGPPELDGGIDLVAEDGAIRVSAQTTRPAAFLARLLHDQRLASENPIAMYGRHLRTLRFLEQLSLRPEMAWSSPGSTIAVGGLRQAMWDGAMPLPAQALGLETAVETLGP
ncbi:MAG: hypothetical protein AAF432_07080 [Planctomycetota bacterium]